MIARDELAARVLVALLTRDGYDGDGAARDAVVAADALLSALAVPPAAALTEEERADLRDAIWKERTAWLATGADQRSEPDVYANAAAAWFAKRGGAK